MSKRASVVSRVIGRLQTPSPADQTNTNTIDFEIKPGFVQTKFEGTNAYVGGRPPVTNSGVGERMRELNPNECRLWEFADRPEHEADHAEQLAKEFQSGVGQIHPAVVREVQASDPQYPAIKYEIISGSVRWRASKIAGKTLKSVIRKLSDKEAITIMLSENNDRKDISEFARALQIGKVWNRGIFLNKTEMADAHRFALAKFSQYLKAFESRNFLIEKFGNEVYQMGLRTLYEAALSLSDNESAAIEDIIESQNKVTVKAILAARKPEKKPFLSHKAAKNASSFFVQTKLTDEQLSAVNLAILEKLVELGIDIQQD